MEPVSEWTKQNTGAINRIFSNIISNALKYSDGDLSVVMDKNGCVTFSNTAHNLNAVTVSRLFDRFYTVESSRNSTGLGLSIAKLLIERMGGTISAQYAEHKLNSVIKMYITTKMIRATPDRSGKPLIPMLKQRSVKFRLSINSRPEVA